MPLLSIIIPVLKYNKDLIRCISSISCISNHKDDIEIIIICPAIISSDILRGFNHVQVYPESGNGIYNAMNQGVTYSNGSYFLFLGQDDIILEYLQNALEILKTKHPFALFSDVYYGDNGVKKGVPSNLKLLFSNVCHQGIIYSRKSYSLFGPYCCYFKIQADHFLNIKLLWHNKYRKSIIYLNKPICYFSTSGYSSSNYDIKFRMLYPLILKKYVGYWAFMLVLIYRNTFRYFFR